MSLSHTNHLRLVPVAAGVWAVALLATMLPDTARPLAIGLWGVALCVLAAMAARRRRPHGAAQRRAATVVVLGMVAAAAASSHVALAQPARSHAMGFAVEGGRAVVIDATVIGKIEQRATGEWAFDARADRLETGARGEPVRFDIAVRVAPIDVDRPDALDVGARVEIAGTAHSARPGERAVLTVGARSVEVRQSATGVLAVAADLRRGLVRATTGLPDPGAGLIPGLAVGDTSAVSGELDAAMKQSSLSHLTAVSGANCAIVVGLAFGAVAVGGGSRRARVIGGMTALAGFVVLVTPEPSVVRAATMAVVAMLGVLLGRTGAGTAILSLAVTVLLVTDPWLAGSLGFALSAVATASLLLFARPLAGGLGRRMPRTLALALSVPLAAQLACGPLLVIISPTVPLYGVVANLLAAPAAPVATIVGLAACLAAPLPWVQSGLTAIAWLPAAWIAGTAHTVSVLPGDQVPWIEGWAGVAALTAVGVAIGIVVVSPRSGRRGVRCVHAASVVLIAVVVGVVGGGAALASVAGRWTIPPAWSVLACDVGQGDAVLLRSAGAVALIDTGPDPAGLDRCLARAGVGRLDLLVLTHFDADHAGGIDAVIGRVDTVVHGRPASATDERVLTTLRDAGARAQEGTTSMTGALGDATWRVLWPPAESRAFTAGNDASVVIDVRGGGLPHALFLGDLSAAPQAALAASGVLDVPYDLVKVAHHGSADQHHPLYEALDPSVALVTVGSENTYGHPRDEILSTLNDLGARIARTDLHGVVAVWLEGASISVWRERRGEVVPAG